MGAGAGGCGGGMKKIALIIAAYKAEQFIMDCVNGIRSQEIPPGWNLETRIGVDGCPETSAVLSRLNIRHWYSPENVGAYLIRNALIYLSPADVYMYFDADDVMMPNYVRHNLACLKNHDVAMTGKIQCDAQLRPKEKAGLVQSGGAITFTQRALEAVGGFYRHRCAGDTDFMKRLEMAGFTICKSTTPTYYRRLHDGSLTRSGVTKYGGEYRKKVWAQMTANRERGVIKIKPTIVKLEER